MVYEPLFIISWITCPRLGKKENTDCSGNYLSFIYRSWNCVYQNPRHIFLSYQFVRPLRRQGMFFQRKRVCHIFRTFSWKYSLSCHNTMFGRSHCRTGASRSRAFLPCLYLRRKPCNIFLRIQNVGSADRIRTLSSRTFAIRRNFFKFGCNFVFQIQMF